MKYLPAIGIAAGVLVLGGTWAAASAADDTSDDAYGPRILSDEARERIKEQAREHREEREERREQRLALREQAAEAAQAAFDAYTQCLRDEGLDVEDIEMGERPDDAGPPADAPRGALARLAERLGQDPEDDAWVEANETCAPDLREALDEVRDEMRSEMGDLVGPRGGTERHHGPRR